MTKQQRTQRNHNHEETTTKRRLKAPYEAPHSTKTTPGAPKNDPKTSPRGQKKRSRTTRRQENRTKTILGPSWIGPKGPNPSLPSPLGRHLGGQNGTKIDPKTIKNRSEKSRRKSTDPRRSWTRLGAILGRPGPPSWAKKRSKPLYNVWFRGQSLFRC